MIGWVFIAAVLIAGTGRGFYIWWRSKHPKIKLSADTLFADPVPQNSPPPAPMVPDDDSAIQKLIEQGHVQKAFWLLFEGEGYKVEARRTGGRFKTRAGACISISHQAGKQDEPYIVIVMAASQHATSVTRFVCCKHDKSILYDTEARTVHPKHIHEEQARKHSTTWMKTAPDDVLTELVSQLLAAYRTGMWSSTG